MAKLVSHVHKLRRYTYGNGTKVFFCTMDCNFKIDAFLALGKNVLCNICGDEFTMSEYTIKLARPHCPKCGKMKVTDSEGKTKYINKQRPTQALAEIGHDAVNDLRERLGSVITVEKDEDI